MLSLTRVGDKNKVMEIVSKNGMRLSQVADFMQDDEDFVFGRFSVAAASTTAVFIERETLTDLPIEPILPVVFEPTLNSPYPPPATILAPCNESRYRTAIKPENWIDNE